MLECEHVAELVALVARNRPLLGEGINPVLAIPETGEAGDVLYYAEILVVGFFNEKAIVLNAGLFGRTRRRILRDQGGAEKDSNEAASNAEGGW